MERECDGIYVFILIWGVKVNYIITLTDKICNIFLKYYFKKIKNAIPGGFCSHISLIPRGSIIFTM